jgi:hypothetical protein
MCVCACACACMFETFIGHTSIGRKALKMPHMPCSMLHPPRSSLNSVCVHIMMKCMCVCECVCVCMCVCVRARVRVCLRLFWAHKYWKKGMENAPHALLNVAPAPELIELCVCAYHDKMYVCVCVCMCVCARVIVIVLKGVQLKNQIVYSKL